MWTRKDIDSKKNGSMQWHSLSRKKFNQNKASGKSSNSNYFISQHVDDNSEDWNSCFMNHDGSTSCNSDVLGIMIVNKKGNTHLCITYNLHFRKGVRINVNIVLINNVVYHLHRHILMRPDNVQVITRKKGLNSWMER